LYQHKGAETLSPFKSEEEKGEDNAGGGGVRGNRAIDR
jgi:hypothetical protein